MSQSYRHGSIVGPIILIGIGAVLLLENLGMLGQSAWSVLFDLWPVILIAAGLDLAIGHRSLAGAAAAAALSVLILAGGLWYVADTGGIPSKSLASETVQVELEGVTSAKVTLAPLAAALAAGDLSDRVHLLAGTIYSQPWEAVGQSYQRHGDRAEVELHTTGGHIYPVSGYSGASGQWDLGLTPTIPLDIVVSLVAGEASLPMGDLIAEHLKVDVVFGQSEVVLPGKGQYAAEISGVFGETSVVIPTGLEASIRLEPLLTGRSVDTKLRQLPDGRYVTAGYGQAENQADVVISQVVGNIVLKQE